MSRATLKGTLIIGIVQGAMGGAAFAVAGIQGAVFWGTMMMVLSIIPGVGATLVWLPAVIYFIATGAVLKGLLLAAFCAGVVGTADNILRPILVGKDVALMTRNTLHDSLEPVPLAHHACRTCYETGMTCSNT